MAQMMTEYDLNDDKIFLKWRRSAKGAAERLLRDSKNISA